MYVKRNRICREKWRFMDIHVGDRLQTGPTPAHCPQADHSANSPLTAGGNCSRTVGIGDVSNSSGRPNQAEVVRQPASSHLIPPRCNAQHCFALQEMYFPGHKVGSVTESRISPCRCRICELDGCNMEKQLNCGKYEAFQHWLIRGESVRDLIG